MDNQFGQLDIKTGIKIVRYLVEKQIDIILDVRQIKRKKNRQIVTEKDRQIHKQLDRQLDRQIVREKDRQVYKDRCIDSQIDRK